MWIADCRKGALYGSREGIAVGKAHLRIREKAKWEKNRAKGVNGEKEKGGPLFRMFSFSPFSPFAFSPLLPLGLSAQEASNLQAEDRLIKRVMAREEGILIGFYPTPFDIGISAKKTDTPRTSLDS